MKSYECTGCGRTFGVELMQGEQAEAVFCPYCGCRSLTRPWHRFFGKGKGATR